MRHPLLADIALRLADRNIATLRYNFPYMQRMSRMIDRPETLYGTVKAAVAKARSLAPGLPVFAGGRAFGARTTSVAQSKRLVEGLRGLVFIGFPLHPLTRRSTAAADHLSKVDLPIQFIQGTRDASADSDLIGEVVSRLGALATVSWIEGADHSFKLPGEGSRTAHSTAGAIADAMSEWILGRTMD
ncbi:alpha/beta hydrolase [soil metagenome]